MRDSIASFIRDSLSASCPPASPLLQCDWAALAFDRNRYDDLVPSTVWNALFKAHEINAGAPDQIGVISFTDLEEGKPPLYLPATLTSLRNYWSDGARFLFDHYVFSPSFEWLIRLDQDVTLIAGKISFIRMVVTELGGLQEVMAQMKDDFSPGDTDPVGLGRYLELITEGL